MPQAAIIALTFGDSKCASRKSRGLASRRRPRSSSHAKPLERHADHRTRAAAKEGIGDPSKPKMCGASSPNRASIARHAWASFVEIAAIAPAVFSRSLLTPRYVLSRKTLAKQSAAGAKLSPCAASASLWAAKNGEPANMERFIAQRSWRKPGRVTSRVLTAPPGSAACSITATDQPRSRRWIAAARPLQPAPTTTASNASIPRFHLHGFATGCIYPARGGAKPRSDACSAQCLSLRRKALRQRYPARFERLVAWA